MVTKPWTREDGVEPDTKAKICDEYDKAYWNQEQLADRWGYPVDVIRAIVLEEPPYDSVAGR